MVAGGLVGGPLRVSDVRCFVSLPLQRPAYALRAAAANAVSHAPRRGPDNRVCVVLVSLRGAVWLPLRREVHVREHPPQLQRLGQAGRRGAHGPGPGAHVELPPHLPAVQERALPRAERGGLRTQRGAGPGPGRGGAAGPAKLSTHGHPVGAHQRGRRWRGALAPHQPAGLQRGGSCGGRAHVLRGVDELCGAGQGARLLP
mmetsp:Transcript_68155/g.202813  ORF Transcript_68155/g.202813 Transcript_68155/m.202813 type:complete len:201 (+) Transcript_68155:872-1474(+)